MSKSRVLFLMTGSIACYKACHVISRLVQNNCDVQVVASPAALKFVGNATLEGLTGHPTISDMYTPGNVMDHIHLMRWADLILVAPATASFLNKAAQGVGDDLLQTLFLAHDFKKPFLIAPAMNTSMYTHPITQKSLKVLREMGLQILDTAAGILACGEEGWGRLLEPDQIVTSALKALESSGSSSKPASSNSGTPRAKKVPGKFAKILITAGGTQEAIDSVRAITNLSSGNTGIHLAEYLSALGFDVTLLRSQSSKKSLQLQQQETFTSFVNLDERIKSLLSQQDFTHVVHSAAVSDYSLENVEVAGQKISFTELTKLSSDSPSLTLNLKRNHKIVDRLKDYAKNKELQVIAFKLTSHATTEERQTAILKLFTNSKADAVVHNDLSEIDKIQGLHRFHFHKASNLSGGLSKALECEGTEQLYAEIAQAIFNKEFL